MRRPWPNVAVYPMRESERESLIDTDTFSILIPLQVKICPAVQ
jgi:hypothetical protein